MILAPNVQAELVETDTGRATSFFSKFLASIVDAFGISRSQPWTPGAIAAGATASVVVAVPNAAAGQLAAASFSSMTAGIVPLAFVSAAGKVTAVLWNTTGGAVTPAPGTVTVQAWTP